VQPFGTFGLAYAGVVGILVVAAAIILARRLDPAYPLTVGICLSVFSGNWGHVGIPAAGPDRLLIAVGLAGTAWKAWRERGTGRLPLRWVHVAMLLVLAYALGSALWVDTLNDSLSRFALLDKLGILPFALFILAPIAYGTREQRNVLLIGLLAVGAYLGLTSLFESAGLESLVLPPYITDDGIGVHYGRARGPFLEAAANGLALYACLVASMIGVATWRRPLARWTAAGIGVLCLIGIVATVTRQIWVGAAVASVVTMLSFAPLRRYFVPATAVATALVLGALVAIPGLSATASDRSNSERPLWDRLNSNHAALNMVDDRPLLGFGWATFGRESADHYEISPDYPLTTVGVPHHVLLGYAVELGLVGLVAWLVVFCMAMLPAIFSRPPPALEPWRIGLVAYVLCWFVASNFAPFGYAFPNYLLWLWPGIVAAPLMAAPRRMPRVGPEPAFA
jgi:O-antigen ligase